MIPGKRQSVLLIKYLQKIQQSVILTNRPKKLKTGFTLSIEVFQGIYTFPLY
jgi:hypothetical protein